MNLKSIIARVTELGGRYTIMGYALNDGTPLRAIEIKIDDGPWQQATLHPSNSRYSWKLFEMAWESPTPGEHTLVSRAIDVDGNVQPPQEVLPEKVSYWEEFGQFPRTVQI